MQDPLSRLVVNIQARARGELDSSARRNEGEAKHGENDGDGSNPKALEVAKKCYKQLNGIAKDCSEISRRIMAWKRLNQDALSDYGSIIPGINFTPVHCSKCAPAVTHKIVGASLRFTIVQYGIYGEGLSVKTSSDVSLMVK